jgi:hemin uptake protein HemP
MCKDDLMAWDQKPGEHRVGDACGRPAANKDPMPNWIDSRAILGDKDEVIIRHGNQMYRLRLTRYGKLILNK